MKTLLLMLISTVALAQARPNRDGVNGAGGSSSGGGGGISFGVGGAYVTATAATGTFYVDPTGNDSGACTSPGVAACASLTGAYTKLPWRIQFPQTINIAAGTYTENNLTFSAEIASDVSIVGPALTNAVPATGAATGTFSAVNNITLVTVTTSVTTYTANDLRGRFLVVTSGAASGGILAITDNTASVLILASPFTTAPSPGDSYAIKTPAAIITSASAAQTLNARFVSAAVLGATMSFTGIDFVSTNPVGTACEVAPGGSSVASFLNSRCIGSGAGLVWPTGGTVTLGDSSHAAVFSSDGQALSVVTGAANLSPQTAAGRLQIGNSFFYGDGDSAIGFFHLLGGPFVLSVTRGFTATTNAADNTSAALYATGPFSVTGSGSAKIVLKCLQPGPYGYSVPSPAQFGSATNPARAVFETVMTYGCDVGFDLEDGQAYMDTVNRLDCGQTGLCIRAADGARVHVPATFNTDAGTDLEIDGVSYSKATLLGATPPRITNTNTGSSVWQ